MHVSIITNISSYLVSSLLCARVCVDGFGFYRYLWLLHPEIFPFSYSSNYVFYIGLAVIVVWLLNLLCLERCEFMIDWFDFPIITVVNISHTVVDNIFIRQECWSIYSCQKEKGSWRKRTSRKMVATVLTLMNFFLYFNLNIIFFNFVRVSLVFIVTCDYYIRRYFLFLTPQIMYFI